MRYSKTWLEAEGRGSIIFLATLTQNGAEHPLKLRVEREREEMAQMTQK